MTKYVTYQMSCLRDQVSLRSQSPRAFVIAIRTTPMPYSNGTASAAAQPRPSARHPFPIATFCLATTTTAVPCTRPARDRSMVLTDCSPSTTSAPRTSDGQGPTIAPTSPRSWSNGALVVARTAPSAGHAEPPSPGDTDSFSRTPGLVSQHGRSPSGAVPLVRVDGATAARV